MGGDTAEVAGERVPGALSYAEESLTTCEGMGAAARLHCLRSEKDKDNKTRQNRFLFR